MRLKVNVFSTAAKYVLDAKQTHTKKEESGRVAVHSRILTAVFV